MASNDTGMEAAMSSMMPETADEVSRKLRSWLEIAAKADASKHIIQEDGTMVDELFVLLHLVLLFFTVAAAAAPATTRRLLLEARVGLLRKILAEFEKREKEGK